MRLKSIPLIFALAISVIVLLGTPAKGDNFTFSFTSPPVGGGNIPGTVTGEILGLTNNTTGPAAQVLIESYPSYYGSALGTLPVDVTLWATQYSNTFTEAGGVVTAAAYGAYRPGVPSASLFYLTNWSGCALLEIGSYVTVNCDGISGANIAPLTSSPVPEPSTLVLALTGVVGLIGRLRRKV